MREKFAHLDPIPWSRLVREIKEKTGMRVPTETLRRVFYGGALPGEEEPARAYAQDLAISLLAQHLGLNMRHYRTSFEEAPELYFPTSYAFKPYNRTWIADCMEAGALKHLQNACASAVSGTLTATDGHDVRRLQVVIRHRKSIEKLRKEEKPAETQAPLPLDQVRTAVPSVRHIEVAPERAGFSFEAIEASKALVKQLEAQGLPTGEIKAAIVQRVTSDKSTIDRLIAAMLGF